MPWMGFHSVMERPESVSRVAPPTMTMAKTKQADHIKPPAHQRPVGLFPRNNCLNISEWSDLTA